MSKETCLQKRIGSCQGCNILTLVANKARWQAIDVQKAAEQIAQDYCPTDVKPQTQHIQNKDASYAMGQRREENLIFEADDRKPHGRKLHGNY